MRTDSLVMNRASLLYLNHRKQFKEHEKELYEFQLYQ